MKVFGKAFLSGVVFAILLIVLVPLFAEGMSPGDTITRLTSSPLKIVSILQIMCITGLVFGCVASFSLGLVAEIVNVKKQMPLCVNILKETFRRK